MAEVLEDYAVVVGVSHYQKLEFLKGPESDARNFHDWLVDDAGGKLPEANSHLVLSSEKPFVPIQEHIDEKFGAIIERLQAEERKGRRLYFYFSGHGFGLTWDDTALALPKWTEFWRNFALSTSTYLKEIIHSGLFQEVFFFLDCCRNRKVGVNGAGPSFGFAAAADDAGSCAAYCFSASEFHNKAFEAVMQPASGSLSDDKQTRGLFSETLMAGLKGAAAVGGKITADTLKDHIERTLPELAQKHNKMQNGSFAFHGGGGECVIVDGLPQTDIGLVITFSQTNRTVVLKDGKLNPIGEKETSEGKWSLKLPKGLYIISYKEGSVGSAMIELDGMENLLSFNF